MSARTWLSGALLGSAGIFAIAACKEEGVRAVVLDLGVANTGSAGFSCTEDRSPACDAMLQCALRNTTREAMLSCVQAGCADAGSPTFDCLRVATCLRDRRGTLAECYDEICSSQAPLAARAATVDGGAEIHLYVDYVRLGGTPGCRAPELRSWCATNECRVIRRRCVAVALDAAAASSPDAAMRAIAQEFAKSRTLDDDAPGEPVVVRVVGVAKAGACTADEEDVAQAIPAEEAIGCAHSCPTVLTAASGAVTIDLDRVGSCTERDLTMCLGLFESPR